MQRANETSLEHCVGIGARQLMIVLTHIVEPLEWQLAARLQINSMIKIFFRGKQLREVLLERIKDIVVHRRDEGLQRFFVLLFGHSHDIGGTS